VLIAPLLVTLALKVNSLVGIDQAPKSLGLVTGIGSLLAMVGNPFFGKMSDRTSSRQACGGPGWFGLAGRSLGILIVALAPSIMVVLIGWCIAQLFFAALLAAWWPCCRIRSRSLSAALSPVRSVSVCRSRR
jgi:MFS family permease